ncbi:unnamed protein product [Amoebophrya sp. A25]|nr:unnamed protein product [Amoebophrya sp. A25]|eukprot:GSA25T00017091001.1
MVVNDDHQEGGNAHPHQVEEAQAEGAHRAPPLEDTWTSESPPKKRNRNSATKRSASSKRRKSNHISRTSSVDTVVVSFTEEDGGDEYNTNKARCEREASADGKRSKQHVSSTSSKKQHRNVYVKEKTSDGTAVSTAKVKLQFDPSPPKRSTRNVVAPEAAEGQGGFSSGYDPSISPEKRRKAQGGWVASAKESRWSTRNLLRNMPKSLFGGSSSTQGGRGPTTSCTSTTTQLVNHTEVGPEDEFERFRGMYVMDDSSHDQSKQTTPERPGATKPGGGCSDSASRISTSRESPVPYGVAIGSADTRSAASTTSKTRLKNRSMDDMKELVNHRSRRNNSGSSLSPTKSKLKTSYNGRSAERGSADLHNRSSLKKKKKSSRKKREEAELQKMVSAGPQDVASILKASHLLDEEEEEAGEHSPMKHLYGFREEEGLHFSPRDDGGAEGKGDGLEDDEDSRKDGPIIPAHFQITSECASRRPSALGDMHALSGNYPLLQGRHAITGISGGRVKHMADGQTSKSRLSTHEDAQYLYQTRGEGTMDFLRLEDLPDSPPGNKDSPRGGKGTIALGGAIALPQRRVSARSGVAMQMMGGGGSGKDGAEDKDVDEENSESSEGAEAPTPRLYHKIKCWSRFKRRFENIPMPGEEHGAVVLEGDASFHEALETLKAYSTRDYFQSRHRKLAADATWKRYRDVVAVALILFANLLYIGVDVDDHKPKRRVRILVESQWKDDVDRTIFMHSGLASLHSGMFSASATLRQLLGFPLPKDQREDHDDADFPSTELTINGHRQILGGSSDVAQNGLWALPAYRHRDQMLKKKRAAAYDLILGSRDSSEQARVAHQPGETIWEVVEETTSAARIDNIFSEVEALHEKSLRKRRELLASAFTTSSNGGHHGGATSATSGSGASPGEPDHDVVSSLEQSLEDAFGGQGATLHSRNLRAALNSTASSKRRKLFEHAGSLRILGSSGAPEEDVGDGEASSSFSLSDMQEYNNGDGSFGRTTRKRGPIASTWSSFWSLIFGRQRQHTLIGREEHRRRTYGEYRSEKSLILPDGSRPIQWREAMLHQLRKERAVFSPPPGTGSSLAKNSGVGFGEPVATSSEEESSGVHLSSHNIPAVDHLEDSLVEPPSLLSQLFHDAATFVEQTRSFFSPGPTLVVIAPPADGSAVFLTDHARAYEQKCHVQKHTFERVPVCAKAKHARGRPLMVLLEENKGTNTKSMRGVLKDLDDGALAAEDSKTSTSSTSSAIHEDDVFAQLQGPAIAWRRKLLAQQRRHKRELLAASSASLRSGSSSRSTSESSLRTLSDTLEQDSEDDLLEDQGDFSSSSPPRRILLQVEDRPLGNLVLDLLFFGFFFWELIYRCSRYTYYNLEHFINDNFFPFVCVVLDIARLSVIFTGGTEDKVGFGAIRRWPWRCLLECEGVASFWTNSMVSVGP